MKELCPCLGWYFVYVFVLFVFLCFFFVFVFCFGFCFCFFFVFVFAFGIVICFKKTCIVFVCMVFGTELVSDEPAKASLDINRDEITIYKMSFIPFTGILRSIKENDTRYLKFVQNYTERF